MSEVEKLRALLAAARREHDGDANVGACGTDNDGNDTRCDRCQRIDVALAEPVSDDFRRGAEAMREAIAQHFNCDMPDCRGCGAADHVAYIRALPIPEDRP